MKAYFDPSKIQLRDRCLAAQVPLSAGVETDKSVRWTAIDEQAPALRGTEGGKAAGRKFAAKKSSRPKINGYEGSDEEAPDKEIS